MPMETSALSTLTNCTPHVNVKDHTTKSAEDVNSVLPDELEREIFTLAARANRESSSFIASLLLVAKRVHHWIEPILYETLHLTTGADPRPYTIVCSKPEGFVANLTRSLIFARRGDSPSPSSILSNNSNATDNNVYTWASLRNMTEELATWTMETEFILSTCKRVTTVHLQYTMPLQWVILSQGIRDRLRALPLKYLTIDATLLDLPNAGGAGDVFMDLTHLTLLGAYWPFSHPDACRAVPSLTHVALAVQSTAVHMINRYPVMGLQKLKVMALHASVNDYDRTKARERGRSPWEGSWEALKRVTDSRIVFVLLGREDTLEDVWMRADEVLQARVETPKFITTLS